MKIKSLLFFLLSVVSGLAFGQLQEANDLFDNFEYREAIKYYQKAGELDDENQTKYAYCFLRIHDYISAEPELAKVVVQENVNPINFHFYGICLKNNAKYDEAKPWFIKYNDYDSTDYFNKLSLRELEFQKSANDEIPRYKVSNIDKVNSGLSEFCPRYYKEGILFCDEVKFDEDNKRPHIDYGDDDIDMSQLEYGSAERPLGELYYMPIVDGVYGDPVLIAEDEHFHIGDFDFDRSTGEIYFTKIDVVNAWKPDARSHPRLFKAKLDLENHTLIDVEKVKIKKMHNEDGSGHPTLSEDGTKMYFSSDRPGGKGGSDLYYTTKLEDGSWAEPINLGDEVNTVGDELFPSLENDGTLYFASNGHIGFGELDLFKVIVVGAEAKSREILPKPLNSEADDIGILFDKENPDKGIVVSNRYHDGFGDDDMFAFDLKLDDSYVQGIVRNQDGSISAGALVKLLDENGVEIAQMRTDEEGKYLFDVDPGEKYQVVATTNGNAASLEIEIDDNWDSTKLVDLNLLPTDTVQGTVKKQDGSSASGVEISIYDDQGNLLVQSKTDKDGKYQFALEEDKSYNIIAKTKGFMGDTQIVTNDDWDTNKETDIVLLPMELVQGIITDENGNPISGALVKILDENGIEVGQAKTDANGHYELDVPLGKYTLVASTDGHGVKREITVDENWDDQQSIDMQLELSDTVQGIVLNEDGSPAANTKISIYDDQGNLLVQSWTDEDGHYQFVLEENTTYDVLAEKGNLEGSAHIVTDDNWDTNGTTDIQLGAKGLVQGIIKDANGNPVAGALVKILDANGNEIGQTRTDENGYYKFNVEPGEYELVSSINGFGAKQKINIDENWDGSKYVDMTLLPTDTVQGTVLGMDGKPSANTKITLYDENRNALVQSYTDENGNYQFVLEENKTYNVIAEKAASGPEGEDLEGTAHIVTNDKWNTDKDTDINLRPKAYVQGIIRDKDGNPVAGATVKLYDNDGNLIATTTTDENGMYKFVLDQNENYQIVATTDGWEGVENIFTGENWDSSKLLDIQLKPAGKPTTGLITDNKTGEGIDRVKVTLINKTTEKKITVFSDANGKFDLALSPNTAYTMKFEKDGYYPKSIDIKAGSELPDKIDLNKDYNLGMDYAGYDVEKIYFGYNGYDLTQESKVQLDKIAKSLNSSRKVRVYIKSFCDCRGSAKYNLHLAYKRGRAVKDYLISKGVLSKQVGTESRGSTEYVNNCTNEDACTESEHALNRRSEFQMKFPK